MRRRPLSRHPHAYDGTRLQISAFQGAATQLDVHIGSRSSCAQVRRHPLREVCTCRARGDHSESVSVLTDCSPRRAGIASHHTEHHAGPGGWGCLFLPAVKRGERRTPVSVAQQSAAAFARGAARAKFCAWWARAQGFWSARTFPDDYRVEVTVSPCTVPEQAVRACARDRSLYSRRPLARCRAKHSPDSEPFPIGAVDRLSRCASPSHQRST